MYAGLEKFIFTSHVFRSDEMHSSLLAPGELCKHYGEHPRQLYLCDDLVFLTKYLRRSTVI